MNDELKAAVEQLREDLRTNNPKWSCVEVEVAHLRNVLDALEKAEARGYARGVEDAARLAEDHFLNLTAIHIRALRLKEGLSKVLGAIPDMPFPKDGGQ